MLHHGAACARLARHFPGGFEEMEQRSIWGAVAIILVVLAIAWAVSSGGGKTNDAKVADQFPNDQFPSTYKPLPSQPTLIRNATVLTGTDKEIAAGSVLMENGKI